MTDATKVYATVRVNGEHCPVTNLFNASGEELTELTDEVCRVVIKASEDQWITANLSANDLWPMQ